MRIWQVRIHYIISNSQIVNIQYYLRSRYIIRTCELLRPDTVTDTVSLFPFISSSFHRSSFLIYPFSLLPLFLLSYFLSSSSSLHILYQFLLKERRGGQRGGRRGRKGREIKTHTEMRKAQKRKKQTGHKEHKEHKEAGVITCVEEGIALPVLC